MAKETIWHGSPPDKQGRPTSITAYQQDRLSGADMADALHRFADEWNASQPWRVEFYLDRVEADARAILESIPPSEEADAEQGQRWYANRALAYIGAARNDLSLGDAARVGRWAFALGALVVEADMKRRWEREAIAGHKVMSGGSSGASRRWGEECDRRAEAVRQAEALIAQGHPRMNAYADVARRFDVNERTITRWIRAHHKKIGQ